MALRWWWRIPCLMRRVKKTESVTSFWPLGPYSVTETGGGGGSASSFSQIPKLSNISRVKFEKRWVCSDLLLNCSVNDVWDNGEPSCTVLYEQTLSLCHLSHSRSLSSCQSDPEVDWFAWKYPLRCNKEYAIGRKDDNEKPWEKSMNAGGKEKIEKI